MGHFNPNVPLAQLRAGINSTPRVDNGTIPYFNLPDMPATVLESFLPGYRVISNLFFHGFGIDIGALVSIGFVFFTVCTTLKYAFKLLSRLFFAYFTSSVYINNVDDLFEHIISWVATQNLSKAARSVKAVMQSGEMWDESLTSSIDEADVDDGAQDEDGMFNFTKWVSRFPPRYEPYFGSHRFWYGRTLFWFNRSPRNSQMVFLGGNKDTEQQLLQLTCVGRSTRPIKDLLKHVIASALEKKKALTVIRRATPRDHQSWGGPWMTVASRPSRPLNTVVLDDEQKRRVLRDMNEFLLPSSPRWYATRGIPYRRGYLFHGPPGTGKTSLSFALAGIFKLDIYVISLLESSVTEADLNHLFSNLPRRCVVLLEDIDTAGLRRDEKSNINQETGDDEFAGTNAKNKTTAVEDDGNLTASEIAKAIRSANHNNKSSDDSKNGISLSGLLNAIDGVASHEGRVLVMTTNHPEQLDEALLRPGRVDMQVPFGLATRQQMRELFFRMYSSEEYIKWLTTAGEKGNRFVHETTKTKLGSLLVSSSVLPSATTKSSDGSGELVLQLLKTRMQHSNHNPQLTAEELSDVANVFVSRLPEKQFSPAEIQGFLLTRRKEPLRALEQVEEWRDAVLVAKRNKSKVVTVQ